MNIPKYEGKPLSALAPLPMIPGFPQLWIYASLWEPLNLIESLEAINDLVEDGWIQGKHGSAATETQLYQTARLLKADETMDTWYKPDIDGREPMPVVLAFTISNSPKEPHYIPILNPLPLPQMGEFALVVLDKEQEARPYHILSLPLEARQRWVALGEKLKELSSPAGWPGFTEWHKVASNNVECQHVTDTLSLRSHLTTGKAQADLFMQEAMVRGSRMSLQRMLEMLKKPNWLEQWQEIQRMAHQLALDYLEYHLQQIQIVGSDLTTSEITEFQNISSSLAPPDTTEKTPKKRRGKRPKTIVPLVAKGKETVTVKSDIINREIMNALRDKDGYVMYESQMVAEHTHKFYQKDRGQITITIKPQEGESFDTILHAVNTLGDGCVDTFIALQAIAIDKNGVEHIRTPFKISPDDILEVCGKQKSHGSYTPFQRAEVVKHLKTLSQAHIIATMPGKPKRGKQEATVFKAEGALIDLLSWKIGEYKLITGEEVWEQRSVSIGEWIAMIPELSEQTAIMLRKLLAYSAKNQRYQKRLGLYISFMFRINAHKGTSFEISTEKLLEGSGIVPDRKHPGHFRQQIEDAIRQLQKDSVIGSYERIIDTSPEGQEHELAIHQMGRGWWNYYNRQHWKFRAPERTIQQYKLLKRQEETVGE